MAKRFIESGPSTIVYDDSRVNQIEPGMFTADFWPDARLSGAEQGGRGSVLFMRHEQREWVLRHYYRGGLAGRLLTDQYLWSGTERARSFREWQLLSEMQRDALPAPVPVAACCTRSGVWYRADLIMEALLDVRTFADMFMANDTDTGSWRAVGVCIARFHKAGYFHADLNAYNVQVNKSGEVFLLDWDRGCRKLPGSWGRKNLQRLKRSLQKIAQREAMNLDESGWQALLSGYENQIQA